MNSEGLIKKDSQLFFLFIKNYWMYYLGLEEQFLSTQRYVAFESLNFKTYSSEYLRLLESICSEIDVVGKVIANQINSNFNIFESSGTIYKWWFIIQDWYHKKHMEPISMVELFDVPFSPWSSFQIEEFKDMKGARRFRRINNKDELSWWTAYNKVKHCRALEDSVTKQKYYIRANLGNVCNAITALYLLEKAYMQDVGTNQDNSNRRKSELFEHNNIRMYENKVTNTIAIENLMD